MTTVMAPPAGSSLVLTGVDWKTYRRLLRVFEDRRGVRLTYDRGTLEIMSPTYRHDGDARFLGRLAVLLTEELGLTLKSGGSTTLRGRRRRRGLEPDDCYWIASEPQMRGKRDLDLRIDPPPDLAIEVDVTSSSLDRLTIYAALGVPEVWRLGGGALTFYLLQTGGQYAAGSQSRSFPLLVPDDLLPFLALQGDPTLDEIAIGRQFRAWVRARMTP